MKRPVLVLLLVASMIVSSLAPAFAQDPASDDAGKFVYLPFISGSGATEAADADVEPAVTRVTISTASTEVVAAGQRGRQFNNALMKFKLPEAIEVDAAEAARMMKVSPALRGASGKVQVLVRLTQPSVAESLAASEVAASGADAQRAVSAAAEVQQADVINSALALDANATIDAQVTKVLNAVALTIDANTLGQLALNPNVKSIKRVFNYELDLSETVPYIGGTAVQQAGFTGNGIDVAVLDSGIDYTHVAFGGAGTAEAYDLAFGVATTDTRNTTLDGLFPTARVVNGYDYVGEVWPNGPLAPDPDPIDCGNEGIDDICAGGHGTHVADIIGGVKGVAPKVNLHAVKVCSAVATSCSGVAIIQGLEYAADPNDDGDTADHVDIVNMSLGAPYGQAFDDDSSLAVDNLTTLGVLTVASAGNSADKPFITGTPAGAPSALAVAQTQVPSAILPVMEIVSPAAIAGKYEATFQDWSAPLVSLIQSDVAYPSTAAKRLGCSDAAGSNPFTPGEFAGKILLLDRGTCAISFKVSNGAIAGAVAVVVGLVAPGDPTNFSFGGGTPSVPGFNITQRTASLIKANLAGGVVIRFDPAQGVPLVGHMVGSSSRGPAMLTNAIKPEIGAPGASVSAIAGTGDGTEAFGGTSGAAPMVAGSAALLMQAKPGYLPAEYKALLMNTGETNIMNRPALFGGYLAPITRIGGGEVRVNKALAAPAAAWDSDSLQGSLSFGFHDITKNLVTMNKTVKVRNYSNRQITYRVQYFFRYKNDEATGGVAFSIPQFVTIPPLSDKTFPVTMRVSGPALREWAMNSGDLGANPEPLTLMEMDGYIRLSEPGNKANVLQVPWHVLPRKASDPTLIAQPNHVEVKNRGVGTAYIESYSLIGISDEIPEGAQGGQDPTPDLKYAGYATYPVPAGVCSANPSFIMAFAVNTWERQTHANAPLSAEFDLDTNRDGNVDFAVFTRDVSTNLSDGRNLTFVLNIATGRASAFFFTDHQTNSADTVLYFCGEQIGMNAANFFQPINVSVFAVDNYFTGEAEDAIEGITVSPLGERFLAKFQNIPGPNYPGNYIGAITMNNTWLPTQLSTKMTLVDYGALPDHTDLGMLLLYRGGAPEGAEAAAIVVAEE